MLSVTRFVLSSTDAFVPVTRVCTMATRTPSVNGRTSNGAGFPDFRRRPFDQRAGNREGNDLHRRDHLTRPHEGMVRQSGERDRGIDPVERVDALRFDEQHAVGDGVEIDPTGADILPAEPFQCEDVGDMRGGGILHHVAGFGDARP